MSENHVQEALKNIREKKNVTTVTIAHRLTTIIDSDAIAVINKGSIAEFGDHLTLLNKKGGIYQSLCETQGITPSNPGNTNAIDHRTTGTAHTAKVDDNSNRASVHSKKAQVEDASGLESGRKEEDTDEVMDKEVEMAPMASMSTIWKFLEIDKLYAVMGILGSAGVGALSPCESILTAQIVT